jgi:hypothetical protein
LFTFYPSNQKNKAKYTGKLFIFETDFAIVRADYNLVDLKTLGGVNPNFIGRKASENVKQAWNTIYKQTNGIYYLQYASTELSSIHHNRPLKFIELAESDKDVVALDIKVTETNEKTEFLTQAK